LGILTSLGSKDDTEIDPTTTERRGRVRETKKEGNKASAGDKQRGWAQ